MRAPNSDSHQSSPLPLLFFISCILRFLPSTSVSNLFIPRPYFHFPNLFSLLPPSISRKEAICFSSFPFLPRIRIFANKGNGNNAKAAAAALGGFPYRDDVCGYCGRKVEIGFSPKKGSGCCCCCCCGRPTECCPRPRESKDMESCIGGVIQEKEREQQPGKRNRKENNDDFGRIKRREEGRT